MTILRDDLLCEIGTEELPARFVKTMGEAFLSVLQASLRDAQFIATGPAQCFATPRRIAVVLEQINVMQPEQYIERRGPARDKAFDAAGQPTPAALGFAQTHGVTVHELSTVTTDKGEWLVFKTQKPGAHLADVLPVVLKQVIKKLPLPKTMRFGQSNAEFIRPVRWLLMMLGSDVLNMELFGIHSGAQTFGHRVHAGAAGIVLEHAKAYAATLFNSGYVIADFATRKADIQQQIETIATHINGTVHDDPELLEEVTAIVEYPVALLAKIDDIFLQLPDEVLTTVMKHHQKSFSLFSKTDQRVLPYFITVANLKSQDPQHIIRGNEWVMRARLHDALFFYEKDLKLPLSSRIDALKDIELGEHAGTMYDKSLRLAKLSTRLGAAWIERVTLPEDFFNADHMVQIAMLSKTDLVTGMVGEFPELQGIMAYYYAKAEGMAAHVAVALREYYLPRFGQDALPTNTYGIILALADRLDHLYSYFRLGQIPSGDKDPFALRRAAMGIARILMASPIPLALNSLLEMTAQVYAELHPDATQRESVVQKICEFILERQKSRYIEHGGSSEIWLAVIQACDEKNIQLFDVSARLHAVQHFIELPEAKALIGANKRVKNLLQTHHINLIETHLLQEKAEQKLFTHITEKAAEINRNGMSYQEILTTLAQLQPFVDDFFDNVMVMVDNQALCHNRLALLAQLHQLFKKVADISYLYGLK